MSSVTDLPTPTNRRAVLLAVFIAFGTSAPTVIVNHMMTDLNQLQEDSSLVMTVRRFILIRKNWSLMVKPVAARWYRW